jgi:hypothetical protein
MLKNILRSVFAARRRRRSRVHQTEQLEVRQLLTAESFQSYLLYATTRMPESDSYIDYQAGDWDDDGVTDIFEIHSSGTASGNVEVFVYSTRYSYFDFTEGGGSTVYTDRIVTGMPAVTSNDWEFRVENLYGAQHPDLVAIHKRATTSGFVEVTTLTGSDRFLTVNSVRQTPLATNGADWTFDVGHSNSDGSVDLFAIRRNGSYSTELTVLSGSGPTPFSSSLFQGPTVLAPTNNNSTFVITDLEDDGIVDLLAVRKSGAVSGRIEVSVLPGTTSASGASRFSWVSRHIETAIVDDHRDWVFDAINLSSPHAAVSDGMTDLLGFRRVIGSAPDLHFISGASTTTNRISGFSPVPSSSLFTTSAGTTNGVVGTYINKNLRSDSTQSDWRSSQVVSGTRTDASINFITSGLGSRAAVGLTRGTDANWDFFSVQWDGFVNIPTDGVRLRSHNTDGSRLWIDINNDGVFASTGAEFVSNNWGSGQGLTPGPESVVLRKGIYRIRMQFEEASGPNFSQLLWSYRPVVVPSSALFTTTAKVTPGLVGSYVNQSLRNSNAPADWRNTSAVQISGTRVDAAVDFPMVSLGSRSEVGITSAHDRDWDNFSVQWDGTIVIPANGVHLFLRTDDGSRLWIDVNRDGVFSNDSTEFLDNGWGTGHGMTLSAPGHALAAGTYQIRIQYEEGGVYNGAQLLWDYAPVPQSGITVTGISAPAEQRPSLFWTPAQNAFAYDVWIDNRTTGASAVVRKVVQTPWMTPTFDLGIGRFSAWVRSVLPNGSFSAWSPRFDFQINTPVSLLPVNETQTTARPQIAWDAVPGAVKYDLWIDNLTTGTSQFVRNSNLTTTSWTPSTDLPMGRYRIWVRGVDSAGTPAVWSAASTIHVRPAPVPTAPLLPTFEQSPTMIWTPVVGAASYSVVLRNAVSGTILHSVSGITGTSWTVPASLATGRYRWWVSAASAEGYLSPEPQVIDFMVGGQPTVLGPIGPITSATPQFSWTVVTGAATYELWVNRLDVPVNKAVYVTGLTAANFSQTTALARGTYRIWVRAISSAAVASAWSNPVDFSIT